VQNDDVLVVSQTVQNVQPKNARFAYLITYSQADLSLVPERESFALLVIHAFQNADPLLGCNILQWVELTCSPKKDDFYWLRSFRSS
jgi:hypothetical protein